MIVYLHVKVLFLLLIIIELLVWPYDPTIFTKPVIHQDRDTSRTRERYKPSAPGVDYSLLIVVADGMMKVATGDDSPLQQGAGKGLDWFSVVTEPCSGGTSDPG